ICSALRRTLGGGHEVTSVLDGREALELLRRGERFDVILCDLMMPELSGMDLHEELAATLPDQAKAMVFLTGGPFTPRARQFLDQVTNPRLYKPYGAEALRALVRDCLDKSA
ncbi:MAG: response regulator, partial [Myxococcaceae bacterium]